MTINRRLLMLATASAIALAGMVLPAAAQDSTLLTSTAPDRDAKLEEAAKAEGSLMLYTSIAQKDVDPLVRPFEEKYGIKVTVWRASGDDVLQRVVQEQKAGRATVDLIHISAPEMEALQREGIFQKIVSPHFAELLPGAVPAHSEWVSTLLSVWVQGYNTDLITKEELPKTYEDLLDPKWKGKLGYEVENIDWFSTVVETMGEEKGLEYFRNLVRTNGLSIRKGHSLLNNLVVAGEVPMGLTIYNYMPVQAKNDGAPIDWFALEPAVARSNGAGVVKTAPHPNAAALFTEFMLTDGQAILVGLNYVPTSTKVKSPLEGVEIKIADPADKLDNAKKWQPLYDRIIVRGNPD
ncbi:ABC transporter substrate-binding protein [Shinella lacus]|uniref:Extracellular solute-binding protein n=1 Tax=Shinella lacus TaxID=2654216 RepID=A0ABT1R0L1_9HYPH|nr:extracellular solute-binding protein [Shinella lacus]MCQ4628714.1 extracellular solute-binding protein [Shinella lacus]